MTENNHFTATVADSFGTGSDTVELFDIFTVEALEERLELGGCGCDDTFSAIYNAANFVLKGYSCVNGVLVDCYGATIALCGFIKAVS